MSEPCRNEQGRPWLFRRRVVVSTLLFCAAVVVKIVVWGHDSERIGEALGMAAFMLAGSVIGSYVFGAVWHDKRN